MITVAILRQALEHMDPDAEVSIVVETSTSTWETYDLIAVQQDLRDGGVSLVGE